MYRLWYFCKSKNTKLKQTSSRYDELSEGTFDGWWNLNASSPTPSQLAEVSEFESFLEKFSESFKGERKAEAYFYMIYCKRKSDYNLKKTELASILDVPISTLEYWLKKYKVTVKRYFDDEFTEEMLKCI